MDSDVGYARAFAGDADEGGDEEGFVELLAILDRDGGLMPANREHPLWALWQRASSGTSAEVGVGVGVGVESEAGAEAEADPGADLTAFRAAYVTWLAQKPILLK